MLYGLSLLAGIALLTLGGESLIRGAVAGARRAGVSPLLTGLVVDRVLLEYLNCFGTSIILVVIVLLVYCVLFLQ